MKTRPDQYPKVFGKNFATRNKGVIVQIGKKGYDKYDLGAIGCPHTNAARTLNRVLRHLEVKDLEDLVRHYSPEDFVGIKGFNVTGFYALTCILRHCKVSLASFYRSKVTVDTLVTNVRNAEKARTKHKKGAAA